MRTPASTREPRHQGRPGGALAAVNAFLAGWRPYAELPPQHPARKGLPLVLEAGGERRRREFARINALFRLHQAYRTLGILREEPQEKAVQFERLLALPTEEIAGAIRQGEARPYLHLLQFCFEFGRHELPPRHQVQREFLLALLGLAERAPPMKYSLYGNGLLYTGGGKTHEEMARDFVQRGLGGGLPLAGGLIGRTGPLGFAYDISSTAFGRPANPHQVARAIAAAIRHTGGREDALHFEPVPPRTLGG